MACQEQEETVTEKEENKKEDKKEDKKFKKDKTHEQIEKLEKEVAEMKDRHFAFRLSLIIFASVR